MTEVAMRLAYTVLILPGEPDEGGYWVKVPALPGCVTQGETVEEALANAREAIEAYVLSVRERGSFLKKGLTLLV